MTDPTVPDGADALDMLPMDVLPDVALDADAAADGAVAEVAMSVAPDRADAPVSEITERFLRAILAAVPLERIEELHLFAPLRQGGAETGIAVVAARVIEPAAVVVEPLVVAEVSETVDAGVSAPVEADASEPVEMIDAEASALVETIDADVSEPVDMVDADASDAIEMVDVDASETVELVDAVSDADVTTPIVRHTVYTARYRLVLKGAERGKWETDVVDEADAPLVTVETVVRGVQRRAGEETEILRYSDRQIARALRMEWPLPVAVPTA